jgi:Ser/Thr protein kinase RdoA (MazF antagonist)
MRTELDPGHLRAILHAVDPGLRVRRVSRPGHGLVSDVYLVDTASLGLVLKVYADDVAAWKPGKEQVLHAHLRALGIPSPRVLAVDVTCQVVPFAWALSERVEGTVYTDLADVRDASVHVAISAQLGDVLGRLHATTFARFGEPHERRGALVPGAVHELGEAGPFATWPEMHRHIVAARLDAMRQTPFADLVPPVAAWFDRHQHLLAGGIVPRLLHMDLHAGNILVRDGQVVAILDLEESIIGHNEYDLMRTWLALFRGAPPAREAAFLAAYRRHVPLDPEEHAARRTFYDVSRTLVWIRSLLDHGDAYARGAASHSTGAARAHLLALLRRA